jgi:hypothetical protein
MAPGSSFLRALIALALGFGGGAACVICAARAQSPQPSPTVSVSASTPDALGTLSKMVRAMSAQPSPSPATYDETITPHGLNVRIIASGGQAVVHIAYSSDPKAQVFHVEQDDGQSTGGVVDTISGKRYSAEQLFWSPTLSATRSSETNPPAKGQATVLNAVRTRAIADLLAGSDTYYNATLVGIENLNGMSVYHFHLIARQDPAAHPLTDVFVDEQSYLVRRAVAAFTDNTVANVTGTMMLDFDRIGKFWMLTSGQVQATVHAYFRKVSGSATFAASNVKF